MGIVEAISKSKIGVASSITRLADGNKWIAIIEEDYGGLFDLFIGELGYIPKLAASGVTLRLAERRASAAGFGEWECCQYMP